MSAQELSDVARSLVAAGKGLLAIDESNGTCDKHVDGALVGGASLDAHSYAALL